MKPTMRVPTAPCCPFTTETNYTHCDILLLMCLVSLLCAFSGGVKGSGVVAVAYVDKARSNGCRCAGMVA